MGPWALVETWAFVLSEAGAMEGSEQGKRGLTQGFAGFPWCKWGMDCRGEGRICQSAEGLPSSLGSMP